MSYLPRFLFLRCAFASCSSGSLQGQLGLVQPLRLQRQEGRHPFERAHREFQALIDVFDASLSLPLFLYLASSLVLPLLARPISLLLCFSPLSFSPFSSAFTCAPSLSGIVRTTFVVDWLSLTLARSAISYHSFNS
jgi:hypothetical protein